jgi:hypothetical protein
MEVFNQYIKPLAKSIISTDVTLSIHSINS